MDSTKANVILNHPDGPSGRRELVIVPIPRSPGWQRRTYPIKMTPLQRTSLLDHTGLGPGLTREIERCGGGTQAIEFRRDELDVLSDKIGEAIAYARSSHKARLLSLNDACKGLVLSLGKAQVDAMFGR